MKRELIQFALILMTGSLVLTACKKNDGGTEIMSVKPRQKASQVDTKAQSVLKDKASTDDASSDNDDADSSNTKWLADKYTGASEDSLRDHLTKAMNAKMEKSPLKDEYLTTSGSVEAVRFAMMGDSIQLSVDHNLSNGGVDFRTTVLTGTFEPNSRAALLERVESTSDSFSDTEMNGVAICADQDSGNCHILVVRLSVGENEIPVWILVRNTNANVGVGKTSDLKGNQAKMLQEYFENTSNNSKPGVQTVYVESFEVIRGKSGMKITTVMNDNEAVSAEGSLIAAKNSVLTDFEWEKKLDVADVVYLMGVHADVKSNLQNTLSKVRMITNDGKKEFSLKYSFNDGGDLDVTYSRVGVKALDIPSIAEIFKSMNVNAEL